MELIHTSPEAITKRFLNVVKITNYNITTLPDFRRGFLGFFGFDEGLDSSESSYILNTKKTNKLYTDLLQLQFHTHHWKNTAFLSSKP